MNTISEKLNAISPSLLPAVGVVSLFIAAMLVYYIVKQILVVQVRRVAEKSSVTWDNALVEHKVFGRLAQVIPALILYSGIAFVSGLPEGAVELIRNVSMGFMVLMLTFALNSMLGAANTIYSALPVARDRPLKGFVQLVQIALWIFGAVLAVAAILDRSPLLLLSGFGALTAILLLVFKDTILSLVASVQLTAQDMVRVGDWIEMPKFGADGDVVDVQLHTIKVQNWDKTITTIPTHMFISDSFKNWRGMSDTGARRIKRALYLDVSSVRFQTQEEVDHFKRFALLKDYITEKEQELREYNEGLDENHADKVNRLRLTNIGTFRAYTLNYLKNRPDIHDEMTLLVRQLDPGPEGLPLQIYCFTRTTVWSEYETIQSDIFDHLMAIVPEFGLRLFQNPTGADLAMWRQTAESDAANEDDEKEKESVTL